MPALPSVPGVVKLRLHYTVGTDTTTGYHVYLAYGTTPPTTAQLNTMCSTIVSSYAGSMNALFHASTTFNTLDATDLSSPTGAIGVASAGLTGARAGTALPANAAALINFKVSRRYRGGKPRIYLPAGASGDLLNNQTWTTAFVSAVNSDWNGFLAGMLSAVNVWGSGAALCTVSYYHGHTWATDTLGNYHRVPTLRTTPVVDVIAASACSSSVASQRRRLHH